MHRKRFNIKAILLDPILRKKLIVSLIKATQNSEGIKTSLEDAERAYDKVRMER